MKAKLKVVHIIPNLLQGGAERLLIDTCNELNTRKDVNVLAIVLSNEISYLPTEINFKYKVVPVQVKLSVLKKDLIIVNELQQVITDFGPDVIHTHLFYAELIARLCSYPSAKWFSHCHDNMKEVLKPKRSLKDTKKNLIHKYERKKLFKGYKKNGGTTFIAISKDCEKYFNHNGKPHKVKYLANAINFKKFFYPIKTEYVEQLQLVNVGSMVNKKNQVFLIEVAQILQNKGVNFNLTFLGDGPNFSDLQKKVIAHNLSNKVLFLGNVNNVPEHLKNSAIYVHSASYEPFGLVLLEAMAAGLPVVCIEAGGNKDIVEHGITGLIFNKDCSAEDFTDQLLALWVDKKSMRKIAENAQKFAQQHDIIAYVDELEQIYRSD